MRILISTQYYHPAYALGGIVANAVALSRGLARLGHEVSVVTTTLEDLSRRPRACSRTEIIQGVKVHYLGSWLRYRKSQINPTIFWHTRIKPLEFDALHIIGLFDSLGPALARLAHRRGIFFSIEPAGMFIAGTRSFWLKKLYHRITRRLLIENAETIIVTSKKEWNDAVHIGLKPEKLMLRRNGVELSEFQYLPPKGNFRKLIGITTKEPLILWLGRIEPIKNLHQLLIALSGIKDLSWHLAIVGPTESTDYLSYLRNLTKELSINSRVHFVPPLFGCEKLSIFSDADLLVLVSLSENWGNSVQEAIAAGIPVIVTDSCGVSEFVENKGGLVVKTEVNAIRDGIKRMLLDYDLYQDIKRNLSALAADLNWDEPIKIMSNLFDSWQYKTIRAHY